MPEIESEQENTIAGYVIELLQAIPKEGDRCCDETYRFEVKSMDNNRIDQILVTILGGDE